jgi:hypothetical protein
MSMIWAPHAHAYLDPATGSILLQGLLAGVAGLMVVLRLHWARVKSFFRRFRHGTDESPRPLEKTTRSKASASDPS